MFHSVFDAGYQRIRQGTVFYCTVVGIYGIGINNDKTELFDQTG